MSFKEQVNYLRHLKRLYEFRYRELAFFMQFAAVGASGMAIDLVCFLTALTCLPVSLARAVAIWVAMTWNFALNRTVTFAAHRSDEFLQQYARFCASCLLGAFANWGVSLSSLVRGTRSAGLAHCAGTRGSGRRSAIQFRTVSSNRVSRPRSRSTKLATGRAHAQRRLKIDRSYNRETASEQRLRFRDSS